jgi:hypothetical protein
VNREDDIIFVNQYRVRESELLYAGANPLDLPTGMIANILGMRLSERLVGGALAQSANSVSTACSICPTATS